MIENKPDWLTDLTNFFVYMSLGCPENFQNRRMAWIPACEKNKIEWKWRSTTMWMQPHEYNQVNKAKWM